MSDGDGNESGSGSGQSSSSASGNGGGLAALLQMVFGKVAAVFSRDGSSSGVSTAGGEATAGDAGVDSVKLADVAPIPPSALSNGNRGKLGNSGELGGGAVPSDISVSETSWYAIAEKLVKDFESCVLVAYPDPGPTGLPWTIGFGATGPGIVKGTVWTQSQCDARLHADLLARGPVIDRFVTVPLTQPEKGALVDFLFNEGQGNFAGSTLLQLLNQGNYKAAADEFPKWNLSHGVVMPGLVRRRAAERALFLGI